MKHTKLPWSYGGQYYNDWGGKYEAIMEVNGVDEVVGENSLTKEDAEFIVKACNEYYPMIKIIKALIEKLDDDVWMLELSKNEIICTESIKQIIEQAEES